MSQHLRQDLPALHYLQTRPQWVCWRYEQRDGKDTKVPYDPRSGRRAESNNPATWASYQEAFAIWRKRPQRYQGIGYMFNGDITGVDLDHCIDEQGNIDPWAQALLTQISSYAERSPSDRGIHILVQGTIPKGVRRSLPADWEATHPQAAIEMYCRGRYFTITGKHIEGTSTSIEACGLALSRLYASIAPTPPGQTERSNASSAGGGLFLDDETLLKKAMQASNGAKLRMLFQQGASGYKSASEADLALCLLLAFWTGRDVAHMDRLFRRSALYREKWDSKRGENGTYGEETLKLAVSKCTVVYDPYRSQKQLARDIERLIQQVEALRVHRGSARENTHAYAHLLTLPDVDPSLVLECLGNTEWGDSNLFAHVLGGSVVYDHTEKRWYLYQRQYWQRDTTQFVKQLVSGVLASVYLHAAADLNLQVETSPASPSLDPITDASGEESPAQKRLSRLKQQFKALAARATDLRTHARINNVLSLAQTRLDLSVTSERWDTDPWLLGTREGVLDLRTGTLRPGQPEDQIRTIIPTSWKGLSEPAPRFVQYLEEVFADRPSEERADLIAFLQRVLGYGISGDVSEHIFLMLFGEKGRNGKDTLMSLLASVLGETVGAVSNDVVISSSKLSAPGAAKPHLCSLQGKRIAWASETDKGARFDVAQVKFLTGGGNIPARHLYGEDFTFAPSHLLILLTNNKPHADASDDAFWERLCPITFNMRFVDQPQANNERKKETSLLPALQKEASGILAWLVRGCLDWQERGLQIPACILRERKSYQGEEDTLGQFIDECCVVIPHAKVKAKPLYERYLQWTQENRLKEMNGTTFGLEMKKRYKRDREKTGFYYSGIGLLSEEGGVVNPGEPPPLKGSPPHETASEAGGRGIDQESRVNPLAKGFTSNETASEAGEDPTQKRSGEGYVPFCGKVPYREANSESEILFGKRVHTLHQSPSDPVFSGAITEPEEPIEETAKKVKEGFTGGSPDPLHQTGFTPLEKPVEAVVNPLGVGVHRGSPQSSSEVEERRCTTRWEKRKQVEHEAGGVLFVAGCWWCERCIPQRLWMEYGERLGYPKVKVAHAGFKVEAGRASWLRFAQEAGYKLVQTALEATQQKKPTSQEKGNTTHA